MADPTWEFEAPRFIDFEANEQHLTGDAEDYFNHSHESKHIPEELNIEESDKDAAKESLLNSVRFGEMMISPSSDATARSTVVQTPSRETFCVKTPSRITRSAKGIFTPVSRPTVGKENKEVQTKLNVSEKKVLTNVMTPSRLATWNSGKTNKTAHKKITSKGTPLRRSLRQNETSASVGPPHKKQKIIPNKQIPKVVMNKLGDGVIPHSHTHRQRNMTSEERELEEIKKMREAAKTFKEKGKKLVQKLEHHGVVHQKLHVTQPKEFHFKTDERAAKTHTMTTRADDHPDFVHDLRRYAPSPIKMESSKKTIVKPFSFSKKSTKRKSTHNEEKPVFVPMAKAIIDFHTRTPRRFKAAKRMEPVETGPLKALHTTVPKTPKLTKTKNRPIATVSAKEKEDLAVQEIQNFKFKARPVKASILKPQVPVKVEGKPVTVPVEFHLSTRSRSNHSHVEDELPAPKPFKAQPVPQAVLKKPSALDRKSATHVTIPMSPAFALKNRIKLKQHMDEEPQSHKFYHPPPDPTKVFLPKHSSTKIEVKPFSFDEKDKTRFAKKEEKIKEEKQKANSSRLFKAQPMIVVDSPESLLPLKKVKEPTKPEPFRLKCDERAAARVEEWKRDVDEEVREMREKAVFKATNNFEKIVKGKPWVPKLDQRPPTQPLDITLRSDVRAKQREDYEKKVREEVEEQKRKDKEEAERVKALEEKEVIEMRREMVHKAQGIHFYTPVEVGKSEKKLTVPESPDFSTRFKK